MEFYSLFLLNIMLRAKRINSVNLCLHLTRFTRVFHVFPPLFFFYLFASSRNSLKIASLTFEPKLLPQYHTLVSNLINFDNTFLQVDEELSVIAVKEQAPIIHAPWK